MSYITFVNSKNSWRHHTNRVEVKLAVCISTGLITLCSVFIFHENFEKSFNEKEEIDSCPDDQRDAQVTVMRIEGHLTQ
jgi:hypothetical protein